jgi:tetratricopeptide (TPR) repeat protein
MMLAGCLGALLAVAAPGPTAEAERLIAAARQELPLSPGEALEHARRALALTNEFSPSAVSVGGQRVEVDEDAFLAARLLYRRRRSAVYAISGQAFERLGRHVEAARHLRRSVDLDPEAERVSLARSLVAIERPWEALLALLEPALERPLTGEAAALVAEVADRLGVASVQAEVDRMRLARADVTPPLEFRDGPFPLPGRTRLSTGAPFNLGEESPDTLVYVAEQSCRTCTADLESVARLAPPGIRVVMLSASEDDRVLRQTLRLYRREWPVVLGEGVAAALEIEGPCVLVVGRDGFSGGVARVPLDVTLERLLALYAQRDVVESRPRSGWNRQRPRRVVAARPTMSNDGLAPGEDEPAPGDFALAQRAFAEGHFAEALAHVDALASRQDGWLLAPEARFDRALCLAGLGRTAEARTLLLRIGDSRFQDQVDRRLEQLGGSGRRGR